MRVKTSSKAYDLILEKYLAKKTLWVNLFQILNELTNSKIDLDFLKLNHLSEKVELATIIGVEDFPGENFENLAKRLATK